MKITLPEGFKMPATAREGEPFEVTATLTPSPEGGFVIAAIDGVTLPAEEEMEEPEEMEQPEIKIPFEEGM